MLSRNENGNEINAAYLFCLCERDLEHDKEAKKLYDKYEKEAASRNINFVCVDKFQIDKNREKEPEKEQKNDNFPTR